MKKIFLGLLLSMTMLTSCNLDTQNYGVIDQDTAIGNVNDAKSFVNGIYMQLRGLTSGVNIVYGDIQMDQFVGVVDNGNRIGLFSMGQIVASDTDVQDFYYEAYTVINYANYFIPKADALLAREDVSAADKAEIKYYLGSAKFARAYAYWWLFDKFVSYDKANLTVAGKGLQIVTVYNPTADRSSYVGRSSIKETVDFINTDLAEAYTAVAEYEANVTAEHCNPNATRVSSFVIAALQARMALQTEDYGTALSKAEEVINSGNYELTAIEDYVNMWVNDEGNELIFVPYATQGTGGFSTGLNWIRDNKKEASDYLPTASVLASYEEGDIRFDAFFELYAPLKVNAEEYYAYAFNKYPGNPALNTTASNAVLNKAKPFRLSELYLIAAEAAAIDGPAKNETAANAYLNDLRSYRIENYEAINYSGAELLIASRADRGKDLIGEGFRLVALRRWGRGWARQAQFDLLGSYFAPLMNVVTTLTNNVTYQPDDYRFVWPIPTREMQVNPQIAGQQNPRY